MFNQLRFESFVDVCKIIELKIATRSEQYNGVTSALEIRMWFTSMIWLFLVHNRRALENLRLVLKISRVVDWLRWQGGEAIREDDYNWSRKKEQSVAVSRFEFWFVDWFISTTVNQTQIWIFLVMANIVLWNGQQTPHVRSKEHFTFDLTWNCCNRSNTKRTWSKTSSWTSRK